MTARRIFIFCSMLLLLHSCRFERTKTLLFDVQFLADLPETLNECSGLAFYDGILYALNDGGDEANIYRIESEQFTLLDTISISSISNTDWEALCIEQGHFYIGDIGNNAGDRQDLKIYSVPLDNVQNPTIYPVYYENQFSFDDLLHDFDCESLLVQDSMILMFSKQRKHSEYSTLYITHLGDSTLVPIDSFFVPAAPTDAVFLKQSNEFLLLCNDDTSKPKQSYIQVMGIDSSYNITPKHILNLHVDDDLEALCYAPGIGFILASEKESSDGGKLYVLSIEGY